MRVDQVEYIVNGKRVALKCCRHGHGKDDIWFVTGDVVFCTLSAQISASIMLKVRNFTWRKIHLLQHKPKCGTGEVCIVNGMGNPQVSLAVPGPVPVLPLPMTHTGFPMKTSLRSSKMERY